MAAGDLIRQLSGSRRELYGTSGGGRSENSPTAASTTESLPTRRLAPRPAARHRGRATELGILRSSASSAADDADSRTGVQDAEDLARLEERGEEERRKEGTTGICAADDDCYAAGTSREGRQRECNWDGRTDARLLRSSSSSGPPVVVAASRSPPLRQRSARTSSSLPPPRLDPASPNRVHRYAHQSLLTLAPSSGQSKSVGSCMGPNEPVQSISAATRVGPTLPAAVVLEAQAQAYIELSRLSYIPHSSPPYTASDSPPVPRTLCSRRSFRRRPPLPRAHGLESHPAVRTRSIENARVASTASRRSVVAGRGGSREQVAGRREDRGSKREEGAGTDEGDSSRGVLVCLCQGGIEVGMMSVRTPCPPVRGAHTHHGAFHRVRCLSEQGDAARPNARPSAHEALQWRGRGRGPDLSQERWRREPAEEWRMEDRGHRCLRASLITHAVSGSGVHRGSRAEGRSTDWKGSLAVRSMPAGISRPGARRWSHIWTAARRHRRHGQAGRTEMRGYDPSFAARKPQYTKPAHRPFSSPGASRPSLSTRSFSSRRARSPITRMSPARLPSRLLGPCTPIGLQYSLDPISLTPPCSPPAHLPAYSSPVADSSSVPPPPPPLPSPLIFSVYRSVQLRYRVSTWNQRADLGKT
ncbi:hypothetical protein B0H17DRAFT_1286369 [Mycena rosella]|uniref:Uncharacterized protein n=1 Tax=Mycena rosella TaxID=1033263 RepID=A0AAD7GEP2_MYCRO|nr:hypothetical protein B0H17DRAFT_1286369 [Mycena rosella]